MKITAYCDECGHQHPIELNPAKQDSQVNDWRYKHAGHFGVWFDWRQRTLKPLWVSNLQRRFRVAVKWLKGIGPVLTGRFQDESPVVAYLPNANVKLSYAASVALTFTSVNSLASDTNLLAGASALAVDNTSNLYLDYLLAGLLKNNTGSAPTVSKEIDVWLYRAYDDTPTYPDTLLGTDVTKTITTANVLNSLGRQVASLVTAATTSQVNPFDAGFISQYFGGCPSLWSVFVVHNSGQALHSSGNTVTQKGCYCTVI